MTQIEHRVEAAGVQPNYSGRVFTEEEVAKGVHRRFVGATSDEAFETHGARQLDFLKGQGMLPEHKLLDIGCGCFRAGRYFINYLAPGNYYGVDANHSLIQTGYDIELSDEQRARLPIGNLRANDRFDVDFGTQVDFALAQSVFTHVSLNHIRLCLYRASTVVRPGGSFFATFFEQPKSTQVDRIIGPHKAKPLFTEKNAYWYYRADLKWAARIGPWKVNYIGDWGHPRNQKMMQFIRLSEEEAAELQAATKEPASVQPSLLQELKLLGRRGHRWVARRLPSTPRD